MAAGRGEKCIGATIRIGRETLCLPYAGFLILACSDTNFNNKNAWLFKENHFDQTLPTPPTPPLCVQAQNTHFQTLWIFLVKECIPNIGLQ